MRPDLIAPNIWGAGTPSPPKTGFTTTRPPDITLMESRKTRYTLAYSVARVYRMAIRHLMGLSPAGMADCKARRVNTDVRTADHEFCPIFPGIVPPFSVTGYKYLGRLIGCPVHPFMAGFRRVQLASGES
jgi:hypothetical protein